VGEVHGLDVAEEPQDEEKGSRGEERDDGQDEPAHHDLVELGEPRVQDDDQHEVQQARQGQVGDRGKAEPQVVEDVQEADGRRDGAGHRDVDHPGALHPGGAPADEQQQRPETGENREPEVGQQRGLEPGRLRERREEGRGPEQAGDRCGGDPLAGQEALAAEHAAGKLDEERRQEQKPRPAQNPPEGVLEEAVEERSPLVEKEGQAHEREGDLDGVPFLLEEQGDGDGEAHRRQDEKFHKRSRSGRKKKDHRRALRDPAAAWPLTTPRHVQHPGVLFSVIIIPATAGQVNRREIVDPVGCPAPHRCGLFRPCP